MVVGGSNARVAPFSCLRSGARDLILGKSAFKRSHRRLRFLQLLCATKFALLILTHLSNERAGRRFKAVNSIPGFATYEPLKAADGSR